LAVTDTVADAPFAPELGETVSHDWFDDADHDPWLVVTTTPVETAPAQTDQEGIETETAVCAPAA